MTHTIAAASLAAVFMTACAVLPATPARAGTVLAYATNSTKQVYIAPPQTALKLNDAGDTTLAFATTAANQTVMVSVSMNVQLSAIGASSLAYIAFVDGTRMSPTPQVVAAATSTGSTVQTASTFNFIYTVPTAGQHKMAINFAAGGSAPITTFLGETIVVTQLP